MMPVSLSRIESTAAALQIGWREDALGLVEEAGERLGNVRLLADDVRDWGRDDRTGIIASQAQSIIDALAVAGAEYRLVMDELRAR